MKIHYDCIPCSINNYLRLIKTGMIPTAVQEQVMRDLLSFFAEVDYSLSPPALGQKLHRLLREVLNNPDPYLLAKTEDNKRILRMTPYLENIISNSLDPFNTAMRLAIAGNVIDFGSHHKLDILETINRVMEAELAVDDSELLRADLSRADNVLYIGDNAGEIVFDKCFIKAMGHTNIHFAVRGRPVLNDAVMEDAVQLGLEKLTTIVTTGDDAPGVLLSTSSQEFRDLFNKADVIISKGQGNFEGLSDVKANIYFLLVTKCKLVAAHIGVPEKAFVVFSQKNRTTG